MFHLRILILSVFIVFSAGSCKKDKQKEIILEYTVPFLEVMEIDTSNIDSLIVRESNNFPTTLDGELAKNNTSKEKIKSAKLTYFRIQVLDYAAADTMNYCNFKDISEMMVDIKHPSVGQELIASKTVADKRINGINMDLSGTELKNYLKQDAFGMVFKYRKRRAMPHQMPFSLVLKFTIVADPLD